MAFVLSGATYGRRFAGGYMRQALRQLGKLLAGPAGP